MGFSVFSKPLGMNGIRGYSVGGAIAGAGVGAMAGGEDHRTSGAIVGGLVGNTAGSAAAYMHYKKSGAASAPIAAGFAKVEEAGSEIGSQIMSMMSRFRK